jgi:hypothetical protein
MNGHWIGHKIAYVLISRVKNPFIVQYCMVILWIRSDPSPFFSTVPDPDLSECDQKPSKVFKKLHGSQKSFSIYKNHVFYERRKYDYFGV